MKPHAPLFFFLRKTKSELPVSGWSTDCGEREGGGREKKEGGAHSHIGRAAKLRSVLRDSIAEHGGSVLSPCA